MDPESLQKSSCRSPGCFSVFVVLSIVFLSVAVAAVAAVAATGVMELNELRSRLQPPPFDPQTVKMTGQAPSPDYKMQNFAYLQAMSSEMRNSTMLWTPVAYGPSVSVGSNFHFDPKQHSLKPVKAGTYFLYVELNFTCTLQCEAGTLIVRVGSELTCEVQLPKVEDSRHVTRKCWTVKQLNGQSLLSQMTVPEEGMKYWKLEQRGSRLGMFLVG